MPKITTQPDSDHFESRNLEQKWFAVYTTCRHEKRVALHLGHRKIEHFLPIYRAQHKWKDGSRVMVDLPLFPGYVFVRIDARKRVSVLEVPGVVSMIGTPTRPAELPDFEVEALRAGLDPIRAEPHPLLTVGQRVRIRSGALAGVEGIVIRRKGACRVVLTLSLLMQSIAIEVDGDDVELIGASQSLVDVRYQDNYKSKNRASARALQLQMP